MHNHYKICILTQTASSLPDYYYSIFQDFDLFFITFKEKNSNAIDFLPNSTWSEGRNRLWEYAKGKYDYYLFLDDDLQFKKVNSLMTLSTIAFLEKVKRRKFLSWLEKHLYVKHDKFMGDMVDIIKQYKPMILSLRTLSNPSVDKFDLLALSNHLNVRATGWFDAQVTLFSEFAGNLLLPYDTKFSGWWSSQVPIYVLGSLAFGNKSLYVLNIASENKNKNGVYRENYDGFQDCLNMSKWIYQGLKIHHDEFNLFSLESNNINYNFNRTRIVNSINCLSKKKYLEKFLSCDIKVEDYIKNLESSFDLTHPYISSRLSQI